MSATEKRRPAILMADDEGNIVEAVAIVLQPEYEVTSAQRGDRALEIFRSGSFDLVISDVRMPGLDGVGELLKLGAERGREERPDVTLSICGEHGGDPDSIAFCRAAGFDYVSCSPFRVPVARLAAAHLAIRDKTANS